jgi:hypothetical protein
MIHIVASTYTRKKYAWKYRFLVMISTHNLTASMVRELQASQDLGYR